MPAKDQMLESEIAAAEERRDDARARFDEAKRAFDAAKMALGMAKADLDAATARLAGLLELEESIADPAHSDTEQASMALSELSRTDAIVEILKAHDGHMSISEVVAALEPHDPGVKYGTVASTLNYLVKEGRVERPTRGRYAVR